MNSTRGLAAPRRRHASSIGGGYAGLMAAHRLTQRDDDVAVTMVNPRPPFVHRTRLQQVLGESGEAVVERRDPKSVSQRSGLPRLRSRACPPPGEQ